MFCKRSSVLGVLAMAGLVAQVSAARIDITNDSIPAGVTKNWVASNIYVLHGKVVVKAGSRLNIQAGTTIIGEAETNTDSTTMLIVARDGRVYATRHGKPAYCVHRVRKTNASAPLAINDNNRGLWGGINIYGRAPCNTPGGVDNSYSSDITISDTSWITFGDSGNLTSSATLAKNMYDTSGVFQYVSVRYTGAIDMSEIKGFMCCGVGAGTVIDQCSNVSCATKTASISRPARSMQSISSAHSRQATRSCFRAGTPATCNMFLRSRPLSPAVPRTDACPSGKAVISVIHPITNAKVFNATFIGTGVNNPDTWKYHYGLYIKDRAAGTFSNSILSQCSNYGVYVEDYLDVGDSTGSRYHLVNDSTLKIKNDIFWGFGKGNLTDSIFEGLPFLKNYAVTPAFENDTVDPGFGGLSWTRDGGPRPSALRNRTVHQERRNGSRGRIF